MLLGFIGTGEITSSVVSGLSSSGVTTHSIRLSTRNSAIAKELANRFNGISVASCNQEVLDHSDTIVIALRPSAVREVLSELRFRPDHQVISLVSALSLRSLSELVTPAVRIARAVPLPSTAKRLSPAAIYHPIRWPLNSSLALELSFQLKGKASVMQSARPRQQLSPISHLMKGLPLGWSNTVFQHLRPETTLHDSFVGVTAGAVEAPERSFQSLAAAPATPDGINEQFLKHMVEHGLLTRVSEAPDAVLHRISVEA